MVYMIWILEWKPNETKSKGYSWYIDANIIPKYAFLEKPCQVKVASMASQLYKLLAAADRICTGVTQEYSSKHRQSAYFSVATVGDWQTESLWWEVVQ